MISIKSGLVRLWALLWLIVVVAPNKTEDHPPVSKRGGSKFILETIQTSCDHNFVEYFHKVPKTASLYTFRVVKLAPSFTIDIATRVQKTKRILYKVDNLDGCGFLKNPLLSRIFGPVYKRLVVNGSFFGCPIKPKVYFLKNEGTEAMLPAFQPPGRYQITMRVRMKESPDPFVMEMLWVYNVVRIK
ncbi:uncharacterized protein Dana_GF27602 [Drosophila ananassae]|uniref:MD-2-related lipid-recognition domain-containing protein n=1 Tax=Drosophila ananassae TaxID=7217 RepID=A0A0P9AD74_DROAN|nr:uncharacterized protein LOC26515011 [Drosophila ananassae]KPU76007.1 uncharacterized protein Dana_GF27602 [Drosophila ananassae]